MGVEVGCPTRKRFQHVCGRHEESGSAHVPMIYATLWGRGCSSREELTVAGRHLPIFTAIAEDLVEEIYFSYRMDLLKAMAGLQAVRCLFDDSEARWEICDTRPEIEKNAREVNARHWIPSANTIDGIRIARNLRRANS